MFALVSSYPKIIGCDRTEGRHSKNSQLDHQHVKTVLFHHFHQRMDLLGSRLSGFQIPDDHHAISARRQAESDSRH